MEKVLVVEPSVVLEEVRDISPWAYRINNNGKLEVITAEIDAPTGVTKIFILRKYERTANSWKGQMVTTAETFDEAEWVAYELARRLAKKTAQKENMPFYDLTEKAGKENLYIDRFSNVTS